MKPLSSVFRAPLQQYEKRSTISWESSLRIQIQQLKEYPEPFKSTSQNWFLQQITNLRLLTQPSGQAVPLFMCQKVLGRYPTSNLLPYHNEATAQFERTLIIVDEGASVHYVEGCTAPTYTSASLHAAIVEILHLKEPICVIQPFKLVR